MILSGVYVYKKYKKRQRAKSALAAAESAEHDAIAAPAQQAIHELHLGSSPPASSSSSSVPTSPRWSRTDSLAPPSGEWTFRDSTPRPSSQLFAPPPSVPTAGQPAEIEVRGKWVWVPDVSTGSSVAPTTLDQPPVYSSLAPLQPPLEPPPRSPSRPRPAVAELSGHGALFELEGGKEVEVESRRGGGEGGDSDSSSCYSWDGRPEELYSPVAVGRDEKSGGRMI